MTTKSNHLTVEQRLGLLGLADRAGELKNLNVKENAEVRISAEDPRHAARIARLEANSAKDLKRWLGVPEGAVGQSVPAKAHPAGFVSTADVTPFLSFPAVPIHDVETRAQMMSYMLSTATLDKPSPAEKKLVGHLDRAIRDAGVVITVFLASDIHVEEGATLVVDRNIQTLFGNHIILEDNATLMMESPTARIDCARLRYVSS